MPIGRSQIPQQVEGKLRGARGEKPRDKRKPIDPRTKKDTLRQKIVPKQKINRLQELRRELGMKKGGIKGTGKKPKGSGRRLYTDENPRDTVRIKFATPADARATVRKVKNINKPFARKIQILTVMEQRAKVMGKTQVVNIANQAKKQIRKTRKV